MCWGELAEVGRHYQWLSSVSTEVSNPHLHSSERGHHLPFISVNDLQHIRRWPCSGDGICSANFGVLFLSHPSGDRGRVTQRSQK